MNPFSVIKNQLYLLQLENYELKRFWHLLFEKGIFSSGKGSRKELVWTLKMKLLAIFCFLIIVLPLLLLANNIVLSFVWLIMTFVFFPVVISCALVLLLPLDFYLKNKKIQNVKKLLDNRPKLKIIGIAGSYGKTTMKNVIGPILSAKFKVLVTPESVNTPIGIAQWFLGVNSKDVDFLIVEMGEHYKGDISYLCSIFTPDIAIVTGVNEAHTERLGGLANTVDTIFELVEGTKKDGLVLLNSDDDNVMQNYKRYIAARAKAYYSAKGEQSELKIAKRNFNADKLHWEFELEDVGKVTTKILGEYVLGDIVAGAIIAKKYGASDSEIKLGVHSISPVKNRLQPLKGRENILIIDDSYNGNSSGVTEAISLLSKFVGRRKIYLTPGLVETGDKNKAVHQRIGTQLAQVADLVILIKNTATPYIAEGLKAEKFDDKKIMWFDTAKEAHDSLGNILKKDDVILFQNDWGDQYK